MAMCRKGCTKIERVFGEWQSFGKGRSWNKVGMQYGELIVEEKLENGYYLCACSCGNYIKTKTSNLRDSISKCLTHCGCLKISYQKDESYFDKIDTPQKAYILGFILTDGCIAESINGNKRIKITLQKQDADILEKIKTELKCDTPVYFRQVKTKLPQGNYCESEVAEINICSDKLCDSLSEYGLSGNKTYNSIFNIEKIPKKYLRDFIRGVVDGDGSFGIYCNKDCSKISYDCLRVIGNKNTLNIVKDILESNINEVKISLLNTSKSNERIEDLSISGKKHFKEVLNFIYENNEISLKRKNEKYLKCIELYDKISEMVPKNLGALTEEEKEKLKQTIKKYGSNDHP